MQPTDIQVQEADGAGFSRVTCNAFGSIAGRICGKQGTIAEGRPLKGKFIDLQGKCPGSFMSCGIGLILLEIIDDESHVGTAVGKSFQVNPGDRKSTRLNSSH